MKTTISHIKADIGSLPGHTTVYAPVEDEVRKYVKNNSAGLVTDFYVTHIGDDIQITMAHEKGIDNPEIHGLAWEAFKAGTALAKKVGLYGADQVELIYVI